MMKPMDFTDQIKRVDELGQKLLNCNLECSGINKDQDNGIVPRGLFLDYSETDCKIGCIVVGINPGTSEQKERNTYKDKKNQPIKYATIKEYYKYKIKEDTRYFKNAKTFVERAGFKGAILWTDLCKCENMSKKDKPSPQTFRVCIKRFLNEELKLAPEAPIVALGKKVFNFMALSYPDRFVVGIPHTSWPKIRTLYEKNGKLKNKYLERLSQQKDKDGNINCVRFPK